MFDVCVELGLDPITFRRNNFQQAGQTTHYGQTLTSGDVTMDQCMDRVIENSNYYQTKREVETFNQSHSYKKRGVYLNPNKYGIGIPEAFAFQGALVNIYCDGSVLVSHGGVEVGQGLHTKMVQLVSHELAIPLNRVHISESANDKVPNPMYTGGSSAADLNGNALIDACRQLNERLRPLKEQNSALAWEEIISLAFDTKVNLSAAGFYSGPAKQATFSAATKAGRRWWYYTTGASCSLVEIDVLTGEHSLLATEIVMDIGDALNPAIDVANIEAAFIQETFRYHLININITDPCFKKKLIYFQCFGAMCDV